MSIADLMREVHCICETSQDVRIPRRKWQMGLLMVYASNHLLPFRDQFSTSDRSQCCSKCLARNEGICNQGYGRCECSGIRASMLRGSIKENIAEMLTLSRTQNHRLPDQILSSYSSSIMTTSSYSTLHL